MDDFEREAEQYLVGMDDLEAVLDGYEPVEDYDIVEEETDTGSAAPEAVEAVVKEVAKNRLGPPPLEVKSLRHSTAVLGLPPVLGGQWLEITGSAPTPPSFWQSVVGEAPKRSRQKALAAPKHAALAKAHDLFSAPVPHRVVGEFPLLKKIYRRFSSAMPAGKRVRVDTAESYIGFLTNSRRLVDLTGRASVGAVEPVSLSLPDKLRGRVRCWQEGDQICVTIVCDGPDGKPRFVTSAAPAQRAVEDVVGYVEAAGVPITDCFPILPALAQSVAGTSLLVEVAKVAPSVTSAENGTVCAVETKSDPALAATMALAQQAQFGDERAEDEIGRLEASSEKAAAFVNRAKAKLAAAQARKVAGKKVVAAKPKGLLSRIRGFLTGG